MARLALLVWLPISVYASQTIFATTLYDEIVDGLQNAKDCTSCHALLGSMKALAHLGDKPFVQAATRVCIARKVEGPEACAGDVALQGPILAHSLRNIAANGRSATLLCSALFNLCDSPPAIPYNVSFPSSPPDNPRKFHSYGRPPFKSVHISDIHIDQFYTVGAEANCTRGICCRNYGDDTGRITEPAGPFGHGRCDTPPALADSMFEAIRRIDPSPIMTLLTGDIVDHANWLNTRSVVEHELRESSKQLHAGLKSTGRLYGSLGNHDTSPTNAFPRSTSQNATNSQWVFDLISDDWESWIGPHAALNLRLHSGSYAITHAGTNLRVISLNTQYWYSGNLWLYDSDEFQPDPNGLLQFLVEELQAAEDAGLRAWVIGHISPGRADFMRDQSNYYDQIVQRYKNTIAAQFFGHSHADQFQVAYSDYSARTAENAVSFGLIAPSLTPTNGYPAFTVYDVDPDSYEVMDAKVYIANISDPTFQDKPHWELYYSARESYGSLVGNFTSLDSLNATFWHKVTEAFASNDTAFQMYMSRISRGRGGSGRRCEDECKAMMICEIRGMRAEDNCVQPHMRANHWLDYDTCDSSALFRTFGKYHPRRSFVMQ
ncbi:sphingomyelin phosphodiesterase [Rickenella mellea]|uniref:Sphingomyelin phosphodiesterase n=1 Tax=Rickenella mellea TaxID=50990 RepID=A0A4Y7Q788_9AGAM|nr:sphingomyelin phosphodiesterase [Rickenella mellea]